tara:strand:+ start:26 stop:310 length:285 start_codon:yes stop_codon:yes gene_type:complete
MNNDKVTMSKHDFWSLRNAHERLSVSSGDVKEMVLCAQERMKHITSTITVGGREGRLPYPDDNEHMFTALRLLSAAKDAEHAIAKDNRINQDKG